MCERLLNRGEITRPTNGQETNRSVGEILLARIWRSEIFLLFSDFNFNLFVLTKADKFMVIIIHLCVFTENLDENQHGLFLLSRNNSNKSGLFSMVFKRCSNVNGETRQTVLPAGSAACNAEKLLSFKRRSQVSWIDYSMEDVAFKKKAWR